MRSNSLLLISLLTLSMVFLMGCDSSSGGGSSDGIPKPSPGFSPDPDILPYDPPIEGGPNADLDPGGDDGSGPGNDQGGNDGSGGQDPVPEPSTLLLVGSGITLITLCNRKKKARESK
jgi:hypothetical protein